MNQKQGRRRRGSRREQDEPSPRAGARSPLPSLPRPYIYLGPKTPKPQSSLQLAWVRKGNAHLSAGEILIFPWSEGVTHLD